MQEKNIGQNEFLVICFAQYFTFAIIPGSGDLIEGKCSS